MQTVTLTSENFQQVILKASGVLRHGGVVLYPTDTLYGLGADAFSSEAVDKIYTIKGRDSEKPIHAVFSGLEMVEGYAEVNECARKLAAEFLPGPLTLVLKKKGGHEGGIGRGMDTVGVRVPNNDFCLELARTFEAPFTTTSANRAGQPSELSVEKILTQLGETATIIDLVIDAGTLPLRAPSTVVNCVNEKPVVLREGAIPAHHIQ